MTAAWPRAPPSSSSRRSGRCAATPAARTTRSPKNAQPKNAQPKNAQPKDGATEECRWRRQGARGRRSASRRRSSTSTEAKARLDTALAADIGFAERLVWFWSNHFCVSADKGQVRPIAGAFEREAIRAHVLGRFGDMLLAVESHPAMLIYLDNARSIGPNSPAGRNRRRGLNENLAREILELHTLGVRSVYTQDDVTNFAKVITGWTRGPAAAGPGARRRRSPSTRACTSQARRPWSAKRYDAAGVEQGRRVLADLARHPATAQHIAQQVRAPFRRRRAGARAGRAAEEALPRHRRRPQGTRQGADRVRRKPGTHRARASSVRANGSSPRCAPSAPGPPTCGR